MRAAQNPVAVYRAPMRARNRDLPAGAGAAFGLRHGAVGIGDGADPKSQRMIARLAELPDGVFVWTRDTEGAYWLGRVDGPYRRDDSSEAREVGIHHLRPAGWLERPFGEHEVPPAVAHTFARGGRNFQRIRDAAAERRSAELWAARVRSQR